MKYEYKMIIRDNDKMLSEVGVHSGNPWSVKFNEQPVDLDFANKLGELGFEMFQVVQYGTDSAYFFRKAIEVIK